jgi:hypothetical protein
MVRSDSSHNSSAKINSADRHPAAAVVRIGDRLTKASLGGSSPGKPHAELLTRKRAREEK